MCATLRSWGAIAFLGVLPAGVVVALAFVVVSGGRTGSDFTTFWESGRHVLHGASPYPRLQSLPAVADRVTFSPFVYPPPAAFAMVPLSLLPFAAANVVFLLLGVASLVLALRLLGVRDPRCYGAAFLAEPVFAAAGNGTVSLALLLGVAAAWRYRGTTVPVGLLVAAVVALKLFLWPLWVWLLWTRRFAAALLAAVAAGVVTLAGWALIGFAGLHEYPHLLGRLTELVGPNGYSLYALARAAGAAHVAAEAGLAAAAVIVLAAAARTRPATERASFCVALGSALLLTPILWPHYLVLLFVPIALARPRLSALWFAPLAFWLTPVAHSNGSVWRTCFALAVAALIVLRSLAPAASAAAAPRPGLAAPGRALPQP
jgi:alpha-1,2-mannosyltransferase